MSWSQLIAITKEARQIAQEERQKKIVACPNDGEPLVFARGVWHCKYDGFTIRQ